LPEAIDVEQPVVAPVVRALRASGRAMSSQRSSV
jgi:hypothetical protein